MLVDENLPRPMPKLRAGSLESVRCPHLSPQATLMPEFPYLHGEHALRISTSHSRRALRQALNELDDSVLRCESKPDGIFGRDTPNCPRGDDLRRVQSEVRPFFPCLGQAGHESAPTLRAVMARASAV